MKSMTRAQAQRKIANSSDPEFIGTLIKHPNRHIRDYVAHKLQLLTQRAAAEERAEELRAKRSAASKKAAATRKAKKAAQEVVEA